MKKLLFIALTLIPTLASAQFVRHTQGCGEIKANRDFTCSFGVTEDMDILTGVWTGFVNIMSTSTRLEAGGGTITYDELPALIQTLRYAKENPPTRGDNGSTRIFFRSETILEITCDLEAGATPEAYIKIDPVKPGSGVAATIPWSRIDELIAMLEKCRSILDVHCAGKLTDTNTNSI